MKTHQSLLWLKYIHQQLIYLCMYTVTPWPSDSSNHTRNVCSNIYAQEANEVYTSTVNLFM